MNWYEVTFFGCDVWRLADSLVARRAEAYLTPVCSCELLSPLENHTNNFNFFLSIKSDRKK